MKEDESRLLKKFVCNLNCRLTHSERRLLLQYLPEICLKNRIRINKFLKNEKITKILNADINSVQKGQEIFNLIRKMRYPLSDGKNEIFAGGEALSSFRANDSLQKRKRKFAKTSSGVSALDSRKRLINPYYYGEGIFDLKEYVVSLIHYCPFDCAYCFLRETYEDSQLKVPPDYSRMKLEINELRDKESGPIYLNAGENADSLFLDLKYGLTENLWKIVKPHPWTFLEFRSKTNKIQNLLKIKGHQKRIIAAFSLNPEEDRTLFETNTATIRERVDTICQLQKAGFYVGLRLEPILYTYNYKQKYQRLFKEIFNKISSKQIHSISLGCMRLTKGLAKTLAKSYPEVLAEEWILGTDKKLRYYKGIRTEIYSTLLKLLKPYFPEEGRIVLSTEPVGIWQEVKLPLKTMPEICNLS